MISTDSRRGGVLFGLLVSALVVVCITIAAGFWVARNVSIRAVPGHDGGNVSISTPVGQLSVRAHDGAVTPESLGIPVYPGARTRDRHEGGGAAVEWTSRDGTKDKGFSVEGVELVTPDPADKVFEFYRAQLPSWIVKKDDGDRMPRLELNEGGYKRIVAIDRNSDGTHIGIATVGEPPAN